jgi:hypothetical protein
MIVHKDRKNKSIPVNGNTGGETKVTELANLKNRGSVAKTVNKNSRQSLKQDRINFTGSRKMNEKKIKIESVNSSKNTNYNKINLDDDCKSIIPLKSTKAKNIETKSKSNLNLNKNLTSNAENFIKNEDLMDEEASNKTFS